MTTRTAKIFQNGRSQAVRLPLEFRFDTDEVYIHKEGDAVVLTPRPKSWGGFLEDCELLSDDFSVEGGLLPNDITRTLL